jgi:hypothetical protein
VPVSLTDLAAGFEFDTTSFTISSEMARAYRAATGDEQDAVYGGATSAVPPLGVAALALGELMRQVALPEGSLHASQSIEVLGRVSEGAKLECRARLAQRSLRGGYVWSVLETDLSAEGRGVLRARATVLSPVTDA